MTTKIEWVKNPDGTQGETWNPTLGCTKGCPYCYMRNLHNRRHEAWKRGQMHDCYRQRFEDPICLPERLERPLRWRKPRGVFVDSAGDLFDPAIPFEFDAAVWGVMAACPQHSFQILTKRPERMVEFMRWMDDARAPVASCITDRWPLPNVHLGVTAEDQKQADERIPILLQCPAAVRFVSVEPMLGAVDLTRHMECNCIHRGDHYKAPEQHRWDCPARLRLHWVICGAESGPGARPMSVEWARSLRDQCQRAGVSYFYKQGPGDHGPGLHKMPMLDGRVWAEMPR